MPKTLLVVDDSVTMQKVVEIIFAHEDFRLIKAANGDEALARVREARPDVVLVDAVLPGASGYDVCQRLRAEPASSTAPLLLMACSSEPFDENRARAAGATSWIQKPFDSNSMLERVRALTGGAPAAAAASAPPRPAAPAAPAPAPAAAP
ncbi:MAG: response regulator, partial [Myxococcota bacterium]